MALLAGKWRMVGSYVLIFGLLAAVNLLPPDTSLSEVRAAGVLRACLPAAYPPLVTGDPAAPGIDVELLRELAKNMDLRLVVSTNAAMGRDFNPRNWHITRAQCDVLAGGVVASP
jgi:ABC-type amino acid transport substrate-binding protein